MHMKIHITLMLIASAVLGLAACSEYKLENRPQVVFSGRGGERVHISPYPMSSRSAAIWNANACWKGCEAKCGTRFNACADSNGAEACRSALDRCDRACVWECRGDGGPLLYSPE